MVGADNGVAIVAVPAHPARPAVPARSAIVARPVDRACPSAVRPGLAAGASLALDPACGTPRWRSARALSSDYRRGLPPSAGRPSRPLEQIGSAVGWERVGPDV